MSCAPLGIARKWASDRPFHYAGAPISSTTSVPLRVSPSAGAVILTTSGIASARVRLASVPAEHEEPDRQQQRLNPQDHGVHEPNGVHGVQNEPLGGTDVA